MANEEVLRLRTTIVTEQSLAQLRALGREIGMVQQRSGTNAKVVTTEFTKMTQAVRSLGGEVLKVVPALGGLGLGAASVGLAFGAVIRTMNDVSARVVGLKNLSADIGLSIRQIRGFQQAASEAGSTPEEASAALQTFAKNAEDFKRRIGEVRQELYAHRAGDLVEAIAGAKDPQAAMNNAFARLRRMLLQGRLADAKDLSRLMFGSADVLHYMDAVAAAQARTKELTKEEQERLVEYHKSIVQLGEAWENFSIKVGSGLAPGLTKLINGLGTVLEKIEAIDAAWDKIARGPDGKGTLLGKIIPGYDNQPNLNPRSGYRAPHAPQAPDTGTFLRPNNVNPRIGGGLYHPSAFTDGFGGGLSEGSRMVKDGVFAALVDFKSYIEGGSSGAGGFTNANFGGSAGAAAGGGMGRVPGAAGFGGGGYTNLSPGTGGGTAGTTPQVYDPGTGKVIGDTGGAGVPGGSRGGAGGIAAPAGTPIARSGLATVTTASGKKFQVDGRFAQNFQGFINDYEKSGGVIGPDSGTLGERAHNPSGHPIGAAIDINQIGRGVRSRPGRGVSLPPGTEDELATKWGLVSGNQWRNNDQGHFGVKTVEDARQALIRNGVEPGKATDIATSQSGGKSEGGKTVKGSWFGNAPGGWRDPSEPANSPKSSVPGIALPKGVGKVGQMYEVTMPDGRKAVLPQTDVGPNPRTGRGIDITAAAAAQMGYTSKNFPTDKPISYRRIDSAVDSAANGGTKVDGKVHLTVNSNGTAAQTKAASSGDLWQQTTVQNYKQMQPTSSPVGAIAQGP
jgi:hypothetical protein